MAKDGKGSRGQGPKDGRGGGSGNKPNKPAGRKSGAKKGNC